MPRRHPSNPCATKQDRKIWNKVQQSLRYNSGLGNVDMVSGDGASYLTRGAALTGLTASEAEWSISAWVAGINNTDPTTDSTFFTNGKTSTTDQIICQTRGSTLDDIFVRARTAANATMVQAGSAGAHWATKGVDDDWSKWVHVYFTCDGSTRNALYVNGTQVAEDLTGINVTDWSTGCFIGAEFATPTDVLTADHAIGEIGLWMEYIADPVTAGLITAAQANPVPAYAAVGDTAFTVDPVVWFDTADNLIAGLNQGTGGNFTQVGSGLTANASVIIPRA